MSRKMLSEPLVAGLVVGVCLALPSVAAADEFSSKDDAARNGDPSASAPSHTMPSKFKFRGKSINRDDAARKGLVCNETSDQPVDCFATQDEADSAMGLSTDNGHSAGTISRNRGRASSHCDSGGPMRVYRDSNQTTAYGGWLLNLYSRHSWYDMLGTYNNAASSFGMNAHSGHLSEHTQGQGLWYPGSTAVCAYSNYMGEYSGWNDRATSRYRN